MTQLFTAPIMVECTKLGEKFAVPYHEYDADAQRNAVIVGLHRVVNDAMAGVLRKDFPTGIAGDEQFRDVGRKRVNTRLANLANADRRSSDPKMTVAQLVELCKSNPELFAQLQSAVTGKKAAA